MGGWSSIVKEVERTGRNIEKGYEEVGKGLKKYLTLDYLKSAKSKYEDITGVTAQKEAAREARLFQEERRRGIIEERFRLGESASLVAAKRARAMRESTAEELLVGGGIMNTVPTQETNRSVNKIPSLDPVDDYGNSIPEVV